MRWKRLVGRYLGPAFGMVPRSQEFGMVPLRQEARERRIISNVKPFIETLRVTNPVRQSRASSRKRVLRGGG
jgi:hypothetical protein